MIDSLEAELDRLFRLPPGDLVAARNALADQLRRAGDKAGAARVKAIKRAAPAAWALNQVHFQEPELLELARERTDALRELQTQRGVDPQRLAAAVEEQRSASQAVVEAALSAWRGLGSSETALQQRKVFTTVQAWLAGTGDEAPGRMTQELEASGFDAFAGMVIGGAAPALRGGAASETTAVPAAPPKLALVPASGAQESDAGAEVPAPDDGVLERARAALAEREQHATAARERVQARSEEQTTARQRRDQAELSVREGERVVLQLRAALEQRERELQACTAALDEARRDQASREAAVAAARAELAAQPEREP